MCVFLSTFCQPACILDITAENVLFAKVLFLLLLLFQTYYLFTYLLILPIYLLISEHTAHAHIVRVIILAETASTHCRLS